MSTTTTDEIELTELTDGSLTDTGWEGTGVFDVLLKAVNENIRYEYEQGRLVGKEYAQVYLGGMQSVLTQSVKFLIDREAASNSTATTEAQIAVLEAQEALYRRQTQAFDDTLWQKLLTTQMQYNGMIFQDADDPEVLNAGLETAINSVILKLTNGEIVVK